MKIAITGGTSLVARHLIAALPASDTAVTLGRSGCNTYCDIRGSVDDITIPAQTDALVHAAAAFNGKTDQEILETVETNAAGTLKMCMAAAKASVGHVVLISSMYVTIPGHPFGSTVYALSKRHAEDLALHYCALHGITLTVLRPAPLYGDMSDFSRHQPFLYHMVDCAEKGSEICIYGNNDALRNYLHIDDLSAVIIHILRQRCAGVFNAVYPHNVRLSEIAGAAQSAFAAGGTVRFLADKPDVPDVVFDLNTPLYRTIAFTPGIDMREGMRRIARYRQNNPQGVPQ